MESIRDMFSSEEKTIDGVLDNHVYSSMRPRADKASTDRTTSRKSVSVYARRRDRGHAILRCVPDREILDVASSDRVFEEAHGITEEEEEEEEQEEEEEKEEEEEEEYEDDADDNDDVESPRESLTLRTKSTTMMHCYALTFPTTSTMREEDGE
ncbi:hypothetical protein V1478_011118 [Vespula squamosa]|uniref:Uncharacterized protein n=1 Tax=Vespula squamosa TaxID=30214 RepID=A0ABD2AGB0_VESSQ